MTAPVDRNGRPIVIGTRCLFDVEGRKRPVIGTVRKFGALGVRCDDGATDNADLHSNGFHYSAWVEPDAVEVIP